MSTNDELLFGAEQPRNRNRDSDGDGVSDAQEAIDGTDANDASDSIRHDRPVVGPVGSDPRADLEAPNLEREVIIDVAANNPSGLSLEQSLPVGLDGQAIPTQHRYGNADADRMMGTHVDENSPLNMQRSPLGGGSTGSGTGGLGGTPPPDAVLSSRAPNMDLVGADLPEYEEPPDSGGGVIDWVEDLFTPEPTWSPGPLKEFVPPKEPAPPHVPLPPQRGPKMGSVDPDAGGGGVAGDADIERAILLAGADTDFVRGAGAPNIEVDSPPPLPRDLVTDRNPDGDGTDIDTSVVPTPPGGFFTDGINPDAGFGTGLAPSPPPPGGGGSGDGGDGRQGANYSATAADADAPPDDTDYGATGGGIYTISDDSISDSITGTSLGGPAIESIDTGAGREFDERPGDVEAPSGIIIPDTDRPWAEIEALEPLDPVAAAMGPTVELSIDVPTEPFDRLAIDDSAEIFDEPHLDDGP